MSAKRAISFVLIAAFVLWLGDHLILHISFAEPQLSADLSVIQAKEVDIYVQVTQQILTLATLVLAGVGFFITPERKTPMRGSLWPLVLVATLTAFSMYFGYLSLNATVWMLSKNFFNLQTPVLYYLRLLQFWTFAVSVVLFAWFWLTQGTPVKSK